ncbi:serine hydrolase [Paenibacillus filicis]|uniref:Serine hydrolase n=1 Tax=Paenibacillus filicis TaxID=669464 RepID=A0ABU9DN05_9BACL
MNKKIRTSSLAVLLLSATIATACTGPTNVSPAPAADKVSLEGPQDAKELEAFADGVFADKMKKFNTVGSNFAVVKDGKVILSKGYGYADKEKKTPVDSNTVFQIGSVTKSFTALAAMQLVDQGKIDLKQDIQEYLGGMKVPNTTGKKLTMYDLLTYAGGFDLPDIATGSSPEFVNQDFPLKPYIASHMPTVVRPPGEAYTYDNFGFMLAGYAVENVAGKPFSQYMDEHIFKPLGMTSTSVRFTPELLSRMASHYNPAGEFEPLEGFNPTERPQGGMVSTANDMAKYLLMYLNQGKYEGKEILSPKGVEQMQTYQLFADKTIPITTIGFEGYFREKMNDQNVVLKGGNVTGHSSLIVLLPDKNTGFYMSYNNDSMMSLDVYEEFMNHYYPRKTEVSKSTYTAISEKEAQDYVGLYENTRLASLRAKVSYSDGKLVMESAAGKHTLNMIHPLLFEDESGTKLTFNKNEAGQIAYYYYTQSPDLVAYSQKINVTSPFTDVPKDSPYKSYIDNLHALKVMSGKSSGLFDPQGTMTQAEFSDVLLRAQGWLVMPYMTESNKKQMMTGVPDYQPNAPITRQMAAVMIQNLRQVEPGTNVKLSGETDAWAEKAIQALVSQGIIDPDTKNQSDGSVNFRSKQLLKRQEASALLDQAFNYYTLPIRH